MLAARKADFDAIAQKFHISPVLARILRNRDLVTEQEIDRFLNGTLADLHDPSLLKGMQEAGQCLFQKIGQRVKIRIINLAIGSNQHMISKCNLLLTGY